MLELTCVVDTDGWLWEEAPTHLAADALDDDQLGKLVAYALADVSPPGELLDLDEQLSAIEGGLQLRLDGAIVLAPGCCCGLDSIGEWGGAAVGDDWTEVWVGHDQDRLQMRAAPHGCQLRWATWTQEDWRELEVTRDDVMRALADAHQQLDRLADRILGALPPFVDAQRRQALARKLAGLDRL